MIIGLTGGIATGKSTVSRYLIEQGYELLDADQLSRQLVEIGQPALSEIEATFGSSFLNDDGTLNRAKLGQYIFASPKEKEKLDAIMQPKLIAGIKAWIDERRQRHDHHLYIVDMPLLFEFHLETLVDEILMITTTHDQQCTWLMERNHLTRQEAEQRIASQWPLAKKEALADTVIMNTGTKEALYHHVDQWLRQL